MAEYVELNSRVADIYDITQVDITPYLPPFTPDEDRLQKDIQRQRSRFGKKIQADTVAAGDLIQLSCSSSQPKFCKERITIPVGKGLFSRELEEKLVGLPVGVEKTLEVAGSPVTLTVHQASRTVLPEMTDEAVAAWGLEGVKSLADLRRFCVARQIADMMLDCEGADMASAAVWQALSDESTFRLDPQEVAAAHAEAEEKIAEMRSADPENWDSSMEPMIRDMYMTGLRIAVVGQEMARREGTLLTPRQYAEYLQLRRETFPNMTEAQLLAKYTPQDFAKDTYGDRACAVLDAYITQEFQRALNP